MRRHRRQQRKESKKKFGSCSSSVLSHLISLAVHRQLGSQRKCDDLLGFGNRRRSREITIAGLSSSVIKSDSGVATGVLSTNQPQWTVKTVQSDHHRNPIHQVPLPCGAPWPVLSQSTYRPSLPLQAPKRSREELPTASC